MERRSYLSNSQTRRLEFRLEQNPSYYIIEMFKKIINNVLEDARENHKEFWVLMQDMSKAYDLVNWKNLWKAMSRIKISQKFINIIRNSLINRKNRVITNLGMTEEYHMNNGIDQGE